MGLPQPHDRLANYADYADYTSSEPDMAITYTYDAFDRQVDEYDAAGSFDQRTIWDGTSALETLNGSDGVTQRFSNGPAVDQVLAAEQVGGSYAGTNWLLADAQERFATWRVQRSPTAA